jgi:hypothetical protein
VKLEKLIDSCLYSGTFVVNDRKKVILLIGVDVYKFEHWNNTNSSNCVNKSNLSIVARNTSVFFNLSVFKVVTSTNTFKFAL